MDNLVNFGVMNVFFSPLSFMVGYIVIGSIAAFFGARQTSISLWWAMMFSSPVIVLGAITLIKNPLVYIYLIININWIIAALLSLGLTAFFLSRPGVLRGVSFRSFFSSSVRPFEGWLNVPHEAKIFGFIGTRPTGLARYSAISSLIMLCLFVTLHDWYWVLGFLIFTFILLFSKGKMELISFIASMGFVLFFTHNLLSPLVFVYMLFIIMSGVIIFGNIPYYVGKPSIQEKFDESTNVQELNDKLVVSFPKKTLTRKIATLSGRINGVWSQALIHIKKSPLIGQGFGVERFLLKDYLGRPASVDNTILNAILQSGILGTMFFIISLVLVVGMGYELLASGNHSLILLESVSVGIFILLRGITQSFSSYGADWMFLAPIITYLQIVSK